MDLQVVNYELLRAHHWDRNEGAQRAATWLEKYRANGGILERVLRDYDRDPERNQVEVRLRAEVDALLTYYGLLELGCSSRYLPAELDAEFRNRAGAVLQNDAVRAYYESYHPFSMVTRFRERVEGGVHPPRTWPSAPYAFMSYLDVTEALVGDEDARAFVLLLRGATQDGVSWAKLERVLADPQEVLTSLLVGRRDGTSMHRSVRGFREFVLFCRDFHELLSSVAELPAFQQAAWQLQAPHLTLFRDRVAPVLESALDSTDLSSLAEDEQRRIRAAGVQLRSQIEDLAEGPPFAVGQPTSAPRDDRTWTHDAIAAFVETSRVHLAPGRDYRGLSLIDLPRIRPLVAGVFAKWSGMPSAWVIDLISDFYRWISRPESPQTIARNVYKLMREDTDEAMEGAMYLYLTRKLASLGSKAYKQYQRREGEEQAMLERARLLFDGLSPRNPAGDL